MYECGFPTSEGFTLGRKNMYVSSQHGGRINSRRCNFNLVMRAFATHNVLATQYIGLVLSKFIAHNNQRI